MNLGPYSKSVAALVVAGFTAAISALADNNGISPVEWTVIAGAILVAGGAVFAVPNVPDSVRAYSKMILAGLIALAASLGVALTDGGISSTELLTMGIALLTGLGLVSAVPNARRSDFTRAA